MSERIVVGHLSPALSDLSRQYPVITTEVNLGICERSPLNIVSSLLYGVYAPSFIALFGEKDDMPRHVQEPFKVVHDVPLVYDYEGEEQLLRGANTALLKYAVGKRGSGVVLSGEYAGCIIDAEEQYKLFRPWNDSYMTLFDIPTPSLMSRRSAPPSQDIIEAHTKLFHEIYENHYYVSTKGGRTPVLLSNVFFGMCDFLRIKVDKKNFQRTVER